MNFNQNLSNDLRIIIDKVEDLLDRIISNGIRGKMDFVRAFEDEIAIKNGALLKYKKFIFQ